MGGVYMQKPRRLRAGDTIAAVSLSWGGLGDPGLIHRYHIAERRLWEEFGLRLRPMPHALAGSEFVAAHPELRAKDLNDAFCDDSIAGIFCAIGGDDTIRILPYVDFDAIRAHPKVFMGYSDSTIDHFILYKAGVNSFYGPALMSEFGEYVHMSDYTASAVRTMLFEDSNGCRIAPSPVWSDDHIEWNEKNFSVAKSYRPDTHGYELLQGSGVVRGHLLGGCIDVFMMAIGTEIWPTLDQWRGAIMFIETSEDKPSPDFIRWTLRNLAAQGILAALSAIIVGKPQDEVYYEEYKRAILDVVSHEEHLYELPVMYNLNFGHASPIGVLPIGIMAELDCGAKTLTLLESAAV